MSQSLRNDEAAQIGAERQRPTAAPSSRRSNVGSSRGRRGLAALILLGLIIGGVVWEASNRVPVDATTPLRWRGEFAAAGEGSVLRIGSFNIHGGSGPGDAPVDLSATAAVLEPRRLDFVGLYEVEGGFTGDQALALGRMLESASLFAGTESRYWHAHVGNGLLANRPVSSVIRIDLPCTQPKKFRVALLASVPLAGTLVQVIATHLDTDIDHDRQFRIVARLFRTLDPPVVLMGDLNCTAQDELLARLLARPGVRDAIAVAAGKSSQAGRVDHILVRGLEVRDAGLVRSGASDHPFVWAELALPEPGEARETGDRENGGSRMED